jgi:SP family galactose:H+ symporter-like MFS transporter
MGFKRVVNEKYTPYLLFAVFVACCGGLLFGYFTAVISGALIFVTPAFHLSVGEQGVVVSSLLIGCILGAAMGSSCTERMGRKKTIALSAVLFILSGLILVVSDSYGLLLFGRLVGGVAVGLTSLVCPLYIAEISPPRHRGTFVSSYQLAVTVGILLSFIVDYMLSESGNWRWMFALGLFPALIQMGCLFFISETPPWLLKQGKEEQALAVLKKLREGKHWINQIDVMRSVASPHKVGTWATLLSPKLRFVLLIGLVLSSFQQITGINTVIYYAPKIFEIAGFTSSASALMATMGIGIINVLATLLSVWLLDRIGRRILLLVGVAGMALSLLLLSGAFFFSSSLIDKVSLCSLMAYVSFFAIGLGPVTWVLLSEIYPLKIRSKAMATAVFVNWGFNYLVSFVFLDLMHLFRAEGTFLLFALISIVALWFVYRFIPETRGKSLEEIESIMYR